MQHQNGAGAGEARGPVLDMHVDPPPHTHSPADTPPAAASPAAGFTLTPGMAQALLQAQAAGAQLAGMPGAALLTQRLAVLPAG